MMEDNDKKIVNNDDLIDMVKNKDNRDKDKNIDFVDNIDQNKKVNNKSDDSDNIINMDVESEDMLNNDNDKELHDVKDGVVSDKYNPMKGKNYIDQFNETYNNDMNSVEKNLDNVDLELEIVKENNENNNQFYKDKDDDGIDFIGNESNSIDNDVDFGGNDFDNTKKGNDRNTMNSKNRKSNSGIILLTSIILSFICGMVGSYLMVKMFPSESIIKNITTSELVETSISGSVDKVYGATVIVLSYKNGEKVSTGTGFVYKKDHGKAYIMTNNHVIDTADSVKVEFSDGEVKYDAKIVGGDKYADIAVLTIDDKDANTVVSVGDVNELKLGDTIFTVGNPMGESFKGTVTKGILSGKNRLMEVSISGSTSDYVMNVIQIDAAVNPGNSGGPLCDVSGNVIGIISLKIVKDEVEGMGFAIPIKDALEYANIIEKGGSIERPYIGIAMTDLSTAYYFNKNNVKLPDDVEGGVYVTEVSKNSPASRGGIEVNDIITELNGNKVSSIAEFRYQLYKFKVGDTVKLTYYRNGKKASASVKLEKSSN